MQKSNWLNLIVEFWDTLTPVSVTVVATLVGFIAVLLTIRFSQQALERQLQVDRETRREEEERQKRAVARAILFEIDGFYRFHIRDVWKFLKDTDPEKDQLPVVKLVASNPFPVYYGNAGQLGLLDVDTVEAIVGFYGIAASQVSTLRDYAAAMDRFGRPGINVSVAAAVARTHLGKMKNSLPAQIELAQAVCKQLCPVAGVPFEYPRIGAAAGDNFEKEDEEKSPS